MISHPKVQLSLETRPLDSVLQAVENGLADLAFVIAAYERHALDYHSLMTLRAVCLCSMDNPLAHLPCVTPREPDGQADGRAAGAENRIGLMMSETFRSAGFDYRPAVETRFMNAAARIVREGWGVTLVDELTRMTAMRPGLVVVPFEPDLTFDLFAVLPRGKTPSRQAERFITAFEATAKARLEDLRSQISSGVFTM